MWVFVVDDVVELVRAEAPRDVVLDDGYNTPDTLTDEELLERGWAPVVMAECPSPDHVVDIVLADGAWRQVWRLDPDLVE